ncbi:MAG: adenylate/guanylate cyclase [Pseudoalteromonas sp.]|uniref:hypothetical protein n=1 Tax=Pseudoalteromonas sp. TaxID=53249 RepID=UPI001E1A98F9|nr:hypothetical protein [Pseudoalteromonas sp.]NRA80125.1 adenylate/guanylate cyclase [Pseudoalteromonas sp.]
MLNSTQIDELNNIIDKSLTRAEKHWENGGSELQPMLESVSTEDARAFNKSKSDIPGHEYVQEEETVISEFIAFVADMRDSTKHLREAISARTSDVSQLQRVFYETSALLPALAYVVEAYGGKVTEFLGDGVLAFFRIEENKEEVVRQSHKAAKVCIEQARGILNEVLYDKYGLPQIDIGVGMALGKALITLTGLDNNKKPIAFGECVFRATKSSSGRNTIEVDEMLYHAWPTSKGGKLRFTKKSNNSFNSYTIGISESMER